MRTLATFTIYGITVLANPVFAASECTELAKSLTSFSVHTINSAQQNLLKTSQLCSEHYDNASQEQKASIAGAYGIISENGSEDSNSIKAKQDKMCEGHFGSYWSDLLQSSDLQDVSQKTSDIVTACFNSSRFRLVGLSFNDNAVISSYRYGGVGETILNSVSVVPSSIASCTVGVNGAEKKDLASLQGVHLKSASTLTVNCTRVDDPSTAADAHQKAYPGGLLSVSSTDDSVVVPLLRYAVPSVSNTAAEQMRQDFDAKLSALTSQFVTANNLINTKLGSMFKGQAAKGSCTYSMNPNIADASTMPPSPPSGATRVAWCPQNTYVAGTVNYHGEAVDWGVVCCPQ